MPLAPAAVISSGGLLTQQKQQQHCWTSTLPVKQCHLNTSCDIFRMRFVVQWGEFAERTGGRG